MKLTPYFYAFTLVLSLLNAPVSAFATGRVEKNFNDNWKFAQVSAGQERTLPAQNLESTDALKVGSEIVSEPLGEAKTVRLPHDWAISGPFDTNPETWGWQGKLPWRGVGWYSKTFILTETEVSERVVLDFGGCMAFPEVYVNGKYAGGWDYGYMSFQVDISDFVRPGENIVQVRCDTRRHNSRWYPGAGIYRPVKMILCSREAWLPEGSVFVTTPEITPEKATVKVQVKPEMKVDSISLNARIFDPTGKEVAQKVALISNGKSAFSVTVPAPKLWDVAEPNMYELKVEVVSQNVPKNGTQNVLDSVTVPFGIRTIEWTADDGFHLNGRRVQLYGVNLHHDQGILGAVAHPTAIERQLKIMKNMGVNAIRTSHNPSSREFLDLCDRMGLIVWNELFDKWDGTVGLTNQDYFNAFTLRQTRRFVERDRNHPCVCVWSIGNEIWDIEGNSKGPSNPNLDAERRVRHVADCFRLFDTTRPVGFGCFMEGTCGPESHVRDSLDVTGWNYGAKYREARVRYPKMPLVYTESASAVSSRGYYELPHPEKKDTYNQETYQVDGYDWVSANGPRDIPDVDFDRMEQDNYVAGEFVWTGFDYLGEPTPFDKVARSSYFGIVDLCGLPKDRYFLYRSYWAPEKTTVHILPHWNWHEKQKSIPVYVYTNGDEAELFLNGRSLGKKQKRKDLVSLDASRPNWVTEVKFSAISVQNSRVPACAFDGDNHTRWCAEDGSDGEWLQIDFGKSVSAQCQMIKFEKPLENYVFRLEMSRDGQKWETIYAQNGGENENLDTIVNENIKIQKCDTDTILVSVGDNSGKKSDSLRYYRLIFDKILNNCWASVAEWKLSETPINLDDMPTYYTVLDKYRLRWEDVPFEPGTLETVAYRDGQEIGRATVRTAGEPIAVRLSPETRKFTSDDDLCYILAEVVDANGNVCPWDNRKISVIVTGSAELVGIDAGNPLCLETITDAEHSLFFGKAMIVLRSTPTRGDVRLEVHADGVKSAEVTIKNEY